MAEIKRFSWSERGTLIIVFDSVEQIEFAFDKSFASKDFFDMMINNLNSRPSHD